ncbi:MAG: MBL fold metallo-hydrolase [Desulfurococcales archaeon]|nr:MBL fold metallo-hydrolase [Desulfurococcales archaeon]
MARVEVVDVTPQGWGLLASYLVDTGEGLVVVDTGPRSSAEKLVSHLRETGRGFDEVKLIVLTHIHLDHAGGAGYLASVFRDARVVVHPRGARHLENPERLWEATRSVLGVVADYYGKPDPVPGDRIIVPEDGGVIRVGGEELEVLYTPGHASHHMSVLLRREGVLFSGDAAGIRVELDGETVEMPTTPPPFKPDSYLESVDRMMRVSASRIMVGHYREVPEDPGSYLGRHRLEYLKWLRTVEEAVSEGLADVASVADYLAERIPSARRAADHPNPIVSRMFYLASVWGLVEAVKERGATGRRG